MSFDFLSAIKQIAPMLAGTLGGPLAGFAVKAVIGAVSPEQGEAVQAAQDKGGIESAVAKIGELFQQGAIQTAQIKAAEMTHAERMAELGYKNAADLAKIDADDRNSARQREIAVKDATPRQLAFVVIGGFLGVSALQLLALMLWPDVAAKIPAQGWLLIGNISGYLANEAKQAGAYYFGTTANSGSKDATIAEIAKQP